MEHVKPISSLSPLNGSVKSVVSSDNAENRLNRSSSDSSMFVIPSQADSDRILAERKAKINEKYNRLLGSIESQGTGLPISCGTDTNSNLNLKQSSQSLPSRSALEESQRTQLKLRQQIYNLTEKLSREQKLLDSSLETLKRTQSEYDTLRGEVSCLKQIFEETQAEFQMLRARCQELEAKDQDSQAELLQVREELSFAQEQIRLLQTALDEAQARSSVEQDSYSEEPIISENSQADCDEQSTCDPSCSLPTHNEIVLESTCDEGANKGKNFSDSQPRKPRSLLHPISRRDLRYLARTLNTFVSYLEEKQSTSEIAWDAVDMVKNIILSGPK